jgi:ribosomal protein S12 methylthiotransferase accessory factor
LEVEALVNGKIGLAKRLTIIKNDHGSPRIFSYGAELVNVKKLGNNFNINKNAGGAGFDDDHAKKSAIGELIERYCCSKYDEKQIIYGSYKNLSNTYSMVNPESFSLFSNIQYDGENFPFRKLTKDTIIGWCKGKSLLDGKDTLIPAGVCYLPYIYKTDKEVVITPNLSTGAAAGDSLEKSIISGISECVERDVFTIFWLNQMPAKKIIFDSKQKDFLNKQYHKYFEAEGYTYHVYDITNDLDITTIYTILELKVKNRRVFLLGAASNLNPTTAILKSMKEAVQGKSYVLSEINKDPFWTPTENFDNVTDFSVSAKLYSLYPPIQDYLMSIDNRILEQIPADKIPNLEVKNELNNLLKILFEKDMDTYFVNMSTEDSLDAGICVVKVMIPKLQPLHGSHNFPFLGGERLYNVPVNMGILSKPHTEQFFKAVKPHPFP